MNPLGLLSSGHGIKFKLPGSDGASVLTIGRTCSVRRQEVVLNRAITRKSVVVFIAILCSTSGYTVLDTIPWRRWRGASERSLLPSCGI